MKARNRVASVTSIKLRPRVVFTLCAFFFIAGFFTSTLLTQDVLDDGRRVRLLQSTTAEEMLLDPLPNGESGDSYISRIPFQLLSWKPRVLYFPNFASEEHCQHIIRMAKLRLSPSTVAFRVGENENNTKGIRTSSGTFISASEDKSGILKLVEEKIAKATMIPRSHGESFNVLHYAIGQKYDSHYDAFNPDEYGPQKSQRVASFLLYLTDVEAGGETMFPYENGNIDGGYDFKKCIGLKVKPRQGDGVLFYSLWPNGALDENSLHGSCPVIKGEKWVATKWIRDEEQHDSTS